MQTRLQRGKAFFAFAAAGQKPEEPTRTITGHILDDKGRPIPGAEVWMPISLDEKPETTPHATADGQGRYTLPVPETWNRTPQTLRGGVVWAFARGHRINAASAYAALSGKHESVDLTLGTATDTSFVVIGPDGRPLAGAVVEPLHFKTSRAYDIPPRAMLPTIRAVTDSGGRATLAAVPREGFLTVQVTTKDFGVQELRLQDQATEPAERTIRLRPAGRIEGRVIAARPEWARGLKVYLVTTEQGDIFGGNLGRTAGDAQATSGLDGSFGIPAIAAGRLAIMTRIDEGLPVRPRIPTDLDVAAGRVNHIEIPLERAVRVVGRIRVKGTGDPVAGASISVGYGAPR